MSFISIDRAPDLVSVETDQGWQNMIHNNSGFWEVADVSIQTIMDLGGLSIEVRAPKMPLKRVHLRWKQKLSSHIRILGDHWERGYGDLEWRGVVPDRVMPWYFVTFDGKYTHGYGVMTGAHSMCYWQVDGSGVSLHLDVRAGSRGVELGSRTLSAARIITRMGRADESAFAATRMFCGSLCENPVMISEPVYGGNNWYYAYGKSSYEEIIRDSHLISSWSANMDNRPFMVIDDGWQAGAAGGSYNGGPWEANDLFRDMNKLANEMKDSGVRPGIWMRPLLTTDHTPASWTRYTRDGQVLDPSIPDVIDFISSDIKKLSEWGYELIKHDFSTYDIFGKWGFEMGSMLSELPYDFADRSKTTAEVILDLYLAISNAAGQSLIMGCNTVGHLAAGIFPLQRTGDDTSGKYWSQTRKMGINTLAFRMAQHGTFFSADPDCVGLTNQIPWDLNRQWMDLVARSSAPLFISATPDAVGQEQTTAIRAAFSAAYHTHSPAEPLDWLDTTCPSKWNLDGEITEFEWF